MPTILQSDDRLSFRRELRARGGESAARCYQCGTCSAACDLAPDGAPFPRKQMLEIQWGLGDRLMADPAIWLCHQCNDCTERCPRDAKPGDVMQTARALAVERLSTPASVGKLVGKAATTWPILIGLPILLWVALIGLSTGLGVPAWPDKIEGAGPGYHLFIHKWQIYSVMFPTMVLVMLAVYASGKRFWMMLEVGTAQRSGSFISHLIPVVTEILTHRRFAKCGTAKPRRLGHLALFWGFVGATATTTLVAIALYILGNPLPLGLAHPFKLLGNFSALLLLYGCGALALNRMADAKKAGTSTAFDTFFLGIIALVTVSGVLTEVLRLLHPADAGNLGGLFYAGCWVYVIHMGAVVSLFLTLPYSKFAHILYRTLAMVHERSLS
jgi:quinone-modifying oxidoreductase, subunit QmoC